MANLILNKKGNTINLTDSTDNKVKEFTLYGKATQNGTPTPDAPVEINVAGGSGSVEVKSVGKNILNPAWLLTKTVNGVTCANNSDNTWTFYGSETDDSLSYGFSYSFVSKDAMPTEYKKAGKYAVSVIADDDGYLPKQNQFFFINLVYNGATHYNAIFSGTTNTMEITEEMLAYDDFKWQHGFWISSDRSIYPCTLKVQIEYGDSSTEFEHYKKSLINIITTNGLSGIPVSSGGNYTDQNGQQWTCDSIVKHADGTGKYIRRIGKAVFDGSDDEYWFASAYGFVASPLIRGKVKVPQNTSIVGNTLCNIATKSSRINLTNKLNQIAISSDSSVCIYSSYGNDVETWKSYLASNPMTVWYELAEPIITDLSEEEIAEIEKLQTFYPVTNISNDADCGMEISYVSTKQNMQVKALLSGVETTFTDLGNNVFEAVLTAPNHDGLYEIEINAVSQTGDSTSATVDLTVASWITSKIDWKPTDRLNIQDFNRIRNNMIALWELLQWEFGHFSIEDMGDELTEYTGRWNVNHFNAFEKNLEIFRTLLPIDDFGLTQTFYYNSMLIKYDELNRIENLLLRFKQYATSREAGIRKLPFRLGAFREVRI